MAEYLPKRVLERQGEISQTSVAGSAETERIAKARDRWGSFHNTAIETRLIYESDSRSSEEPYRSAEQKGTRYLQEVRLLSEDQRRTRRMSGV